MKNLIQCFLLVSVCQSILLTPRENKERLKKCGIQYKPTSKPPRIQSRDAPWLVQVNVSVTNGISSGLGVIISPKHVLITSQFYVRDSNHSWDYFESNCKNGSRDFPVDNKIKVQLDVCKNSNCTGTWKKTVAPKAMNWIGHCTMDFALFLLHFDEPLGNTPICLLNNRKILDLEEVMVHGMSRFRKTNSIDLYKTARVRTGFGDFWFTDEDLVDKKSPDDNGAFMVQKPINRFELLGISKLSNNNSTIYQRSPPTDSEKELCDVAGICPEVVATTLATPRRIPTTPRKPPVTVKPPKTTLTSPMTTAAPRPPTATTPRRTRQTRPPVTVAKTTAAPKTVAPPVTRTVASPVTTAASTALTAGRTRKTRPPVTVAKSTVAPKTSAVPTVSTVPTVIASRLTRRPRPSVTIAKTTPAPKPTSPPPTVPKITSTATQPTAVLPTTTVTLPSTIPTAKTSPKPYVSPLTKLNASENELRAEKCGIKEVTRSRRETYPGGGWTISYNGTARWIARDAPWIVKVSTNGINRNGFLISSRHVLVDGNLYDDWEFERLFANTSDTWQYRDLPSPRDEYDWPTHMIGVYLEICDDANTCAISKWVSVTASKLVYFNVTQPFAILELQRNVSEVPFICMLKDPVTNKGDTVYTPNFKDSKGHLNPQIVEKISSRPDRIHLNIPYNATDPRSILTQEINDQMFAVGFLPQNTSENTTSFVSIGSLSSTICIFTGVCPIVTPPLPIREGIPMRTREWSSKDEYPDHQEFQDPVERDYVDYVEPGKEALVMSGSPKRSIELLKLFLWLSILGFLSVMG